MHCPVCQRPNHHGARICAQCGAVLGVGVPALGEPPPGFIIGGRFRVLSLLGEGGMGRVYLAEQPMGHTFRRVAIKTLRANYAHTPEIVARFERECGLVAQLEHPNTIQFFDFGRSEHGELYIVMEYVEGRTLADVLAREAPLSIERSLRIVEQICGALEEAHARGIVHRDLKPGNIMLTTRAGLADFVKLLDFGIAKAQLSEATHASPLTQTGAVLGTPPYMSPEQFRCDAIDARSDIYSLGLIAYEMLAGRRPFRANTAWEWANVHMHAQPMPFEIDERGRDLGAPMKVAIFRALEKDPAVRQASVRELWNTLIAGAARSVTPWEAQSGTVLRTELRELPEEQGEASTFALGEVARSELSALGAGESIGTGAAVVIPSAPPKSRRKPSRAPWLVATLGLVIVSALAYSFASDVEPAAEPEPLAAPEPSPPSEADRAAALIDMTRRMSAALSAQHSPHSRPGDSCGAMASIPGGAFKLGATGEVAIVSPFCLDTTPVTALAYADCVRAGGCSVDDVGGPSSCNYSIVGRASHPINCVDWSQALAYCESRGKRLPTEKEWEFAARGGSYGYSYPWGNDEPAFQLCWSGIENRVTTCEVGSFPGGNNPWNVQDLSGNVWEWTSTPYGDSGRIVRGGSFGRRDAISVQAANRTWLEAASRFGYLGFRCAKDI